MYGLPHFSAHYTGGQSQFVVVYMHCNTMTSSSEMMLHITPLVLFLIVVFFSDIATLCHSRPKFGNNLKCLFQTMMSWTVSAVKSERTPPTSRPVNSFRGVSWVQLRVCRSDPVLGALSASEPGDGITMYNSAVSVARVTALTSSAGCPYVPTHDLRAPALIYTGQGMWLCVWLQVVMCFISTQQMPWVSVVYTTI